MRTHLINAWYGVVDYAAYPVIMLLTAPILIRHLGVSGYGIFAFGMSIANTGGIIASGFGDANTQKISVARAAHDIPVIRATIQCTLGIHLAVGIAISALGVALAPWLSSKVTSAQPWNRYTCTDVVVISSLLVLTRTLETVAVSTQRAFQSYGNALTISAIVRVLTLVFAAALSTRRSSLQNIFLTMISLSFAGTLLQLFRLGRRTSLVCLIPSFHAPQIRSLLAFGGFTWLQALGGVIFSQADRLLIGLWMGSAALTAYSLAAQVAQPIVGITAAAMHFMFPYLAHQAAQRGVLAVVRPAKRAFWASLGLIAIQSVPLILFGNRILAAWIGRTELALSTLLLPLLVIASAFAALSVTGNYALLALGRARVSSWVILGSSSLMLTVARPLISKWGTEGMAIARMAAGLAMLLVYLPLWKQLQDRRDCVISVIASSPPIQGVLD